MKWLKNYKTTGTYANTVENNAKKDFYRVKNLNRTLSGMIVKVKMKLVSYC